MLSPRTATQPPVIALFYVALAEIWWRHLGRIVTANISQVGANDQVPGAGHKKRPTNVHQAGRRGML